MIVIRQPQISRLSKTLQEMTPPVLVRSVGSIRKVVGLTLESRGPIVSMGDLVSIKSASDAKIVRQAEVVGFRDNRALLMPLDGVEGIRSGDPVVRCRRGFQIPVGPALLGRILDGLGRPLDGKPPPTPTSYRRVSARPPHPILRPRIRSLMETGVRSIDAAIPCGCGQRLGIMAGSGVGKSSLLGMMCRHASAPINVIALIGERGKEVREFIEESLGEQGLLKSVVVVVTSDQPALQRVKGAETAMTIAEYFRDMGHDVLMVMDSVTRYAMAQREIGLAIGEPPATRGYPPSVFSLLPRLLERAGMSDRGSITGLFTVLVEGDDLNDPVGDTVRSILDGQIVLSRDLASAGHYPAVEILDSVSRVINQVTTHNHRALAQDLRSMLDVYRKARDLIAIGAYQPGHDPVVDRAVALRLKLETFLRQRLDEHSRVEETLSQLTEILRS